MPTSISDRLAVKRELRDQALGSGFDAVGFAPADAAPEAGERLVQFLAEGRHGEMRWLAEKADRRRHPQALWPQARSVIVLGLNYGPAEDPRNLLAERQRGAISVYAQGADYHAVVKRKLKELAGWLHRRHGAQVKVFVDTAPVMEKPLAAAAGLGWQGRHTNLVSRELGSWLFLGSIFTDLELPPDPPGTDACGTCRACLDACPTAAFPAPYQIDARRCLSYLTIEHGGTIAAEFRRPMGNRIYGCDDCLAACPWNKFARAASEARLLPRAELRAPRLADLAALDDAGFRRVFSGTAVRRIGRDRFLRNVAIALGNSGDASAVPPLLRLLDDGSALVRAMAVWGLRQLLPQSEAAALQAARQDRETDPAVRAEWDAPLNAA